MRYRKAIHIEGRSLDDIMRLPCVRSVEKTSEAGIMKFSFYPLSMLHPSQFQSAYTGDWLCEGDDGKWVVLSNEQYINGNGDITVND